MIEHQARLGNVLRQALTASGWQTRQRNATAAGLLYA